MRRLLLATTFPLLAGALPVAAQNVTVDAGAGAIFETYRFSDATDIDIDALNLLSTPFGATVHFTRRVSLRISGAWARGELRRPNGDEAEITGLTDTDVRLSAILGRDVVTVTAIAQLPTGVSELTADEADAAGMFAADVLPFRVTNWGSGGGFGLSTAVAQPVGEFAVGLAVGYVVAREFEPLAEQPAQYRPGNQLQVRGAIDRTFGTSGKASLAATYMRFSDDEYDGQNLFRTGDRIQVLGSYAFAAGASSSAIAYAGYLHRGEGEFVQQDEFEASQGLFFGGGGMRMPAGGVVIQPGVDLRVQTGGGTTGYTVGLGGTVEVPLGAALLVPTLRGRVGTAELGSGEQSGFTGAEAGVAIRF